MLTLQFKERKCSVSMTPDKIEKLREDFGIDVVPLIYNQIQTELGVTDEISIEKLEEILKNNQNVEIIIIDP